MLVPELKKVSYDPACFTDIETVDEAVRIIVTPEAGMTSHQRWERETPALMSLIEKFIDKESTVLDYGCGIGRLAKPMVEKMQCRVIGVDISPNMRALATSCVDSPMFCAIDPSMFDVLCDRPMFEAAIAVWALQHCIDLGKAIDRIASTVRSGGHLFVVNNKGRAVPVEGGQWVDDGLDIETMITGAGFHQIAQGPLDEKIAPGWMRQGTFWAVYRRQ